MNDEINAYVEGVRRALDGISEATREELLEDLPEHLAEVQAEGTGTLVERLGTPQAYAAELRATAGLVGDFPDPPDDRFAGLREARDQAVQVLDRIDRRVGPVIGYERAADFLVLLRPAWWVLRGYLAAMALAYLVPNSSSGNMGLLPRINDSNLVALVLLAGAIVVSITLGHRTATLALAPRMALRAGTGLLIILALAGFVSTDSAARDPHYSDANYDYTNSDPNPYSNVNDVYVYDGQGHLIQGARVYDQDGSPIQLGNNYCTDESTGESTRSRSMGYPYCPENAPFGALPTPATTTPSPSLPPSPRSSLPPSSPIPAKPSPAPSTSPSR